MSDYLILVPARFGSSRFPGKPLAKILGRPMIEYVVRNCQASGFDYAVVTDNDEIERCIKEFGGNVVRVDDEINTGSERIALAYERFFLDKNYKYIINVQGDEPLLDANIIQKIGLAHTDSAFDIYTAVKERGANDSDFINPNVVKCVRSKITQECLYFSREAIPYSRDKAPFNWLQHIGIYSYKVDALAKFVKMKTSHYEDLEKLEQLRALENGLSIGAVEITKNLFGVDTPEDIKKIEGVLSE